MNTKNDRASGASRTGHHVDLADPDVHAEWIEGLCTHAADLIMAAVDATKPPALRMLGRKGARNLIDEAVRGLTVGFAAAGLDLADPPSAVERAIARLSKSREPPAESGGTTAPRADHDAAERYREAEREVIAEGEREVRALGETALALACADTDTARDSALQDAPLAGVLFVAVTGSRGEDTETDPPLLQALAALRDTVAAWLDAPRARTDRVSIAAADVDLLVRRMEATVEIARRGGAARTGADA